MKRFVALLLIVLVCSLLLQMPAHAAAKDSDGRVPLRYSCQSNANYFGYYEWSNSNGEVRGRIVINQCRLLKYGAGSSDYRTIYQHEVAHSHGLEHYQKTPETNPAYYPFFRLCHC